ncbi:MAG: acetolactate synthase small subunit [Planctomycetota bacterium]
MPTDDQPELLRHVIAALVTNEPGVLAQVAGMFAARGFNIDSLVVGRTENPDLSRMTIVVVGDAATLEQVRKQLAKLVPVVKVVTYNDVPFVERDLVLVSVSTKTDAGDADKREEIASLASLFGAKVVDVAPDRLMIELAGSEDKLENFVELLSPYGLLELARTGVIAMPRGMSAPLRKRNVQDTASAVDAADLPPG